MIHRLGVGEEFICQLAHVTSRGLKEFHQHHNGFNEIEQRTLQKAQSPAPLCRFSVPSQKSQYGRQIMIKTAIFHIRILARSGGYN
jgi:hypothetical protein